MPSPTPIVGNNFQQPPYLTQIQMKVRRLTRSPSESQLTTPDLNNYINTFLVYNFPENIRTFKLHETFNFYTNAYQTAYATAPADFGGASDAAQNPLYNFENLYLTMNPPVYIGGFQVYFTQDREEFFNIYPRVMSIASIGVTGDGATTTFSGVINTNQSVIPTNFIQQINLEKGQVGFDSIDTNFNTQTMIDAPLVDSVTGNPTIYGNLYLAGQAPELPVLVTAPYTTSPNFNPTNNINYLTGAFTVTFPLAPGFGQTINSQSIPLATGRPQSLLFYDGQFTVRPSPDQSYQVNFEVYPRPDALLANNATPELEEWWIYIAYGAAKLIFEDKMDLDSVAQIMPEFKQQERLCLRRSIVQNSNTRVATIYTQTLNGIGNNSNGWWGSPFS